jgi:hypothetical protein
MRAGSLHPYTVLLTYSSVSIYHSRIVHSLFISPRLLSTTVLSLPMFCYDLTHALKIIGERSERKARDSRNHYLDQVCDIAQVLCITLHERDQQLYYEGLILAGHHGDAFDRNLTTERQEKELRD